MTRHLSKTHGRHYYYNHTTKHLSWSCPLPKLKPVMRGWDSREYQKGDTSRADITMMTAVIAGKAGTSTHALARSFREFIPCGRFDVKYFERLTFVDRRKIARMKGRVTRAAHSDRVKTLYSIAQYGSTVAEIALCFLLVVQSMGLGSDEALFDMYCYCVRFRRERLKKRERPFILCT